MGRNGLRKLGNFFVVVVANAPKKDLLMQRASRSVGRAFQKIKK